MKKGKNASQLSDTRKKIVGLEQRVVDAVKSGNYIISNHAYVRSEDRLIPIPHVEHVLLHGFHEKRKDTFKEEFDSWNYSIRGRSPDRVNTRIVVTFTEDGLLVVTVINLDIR